jgi:tRNA (guanine-N7-)-methyltransferase
LIEEHPERRRQKLYGRRKGPKLTAHQSGLRGTLLPALALDLAQLAAPRAMFAPPVDDIWLEVGFGAGEHLLWQAQHNPRVGLIGAEPYESGVAKLLSRLDREPQANLKIHEGDAREIIAGLPDASVGRVFILFPDPWPKTRHHKRRFVQSDLLTALARIMREGAELRFASDDAGYLEWALERIVAHPDFIWTAERMTDWTVRSGDWPATRYEQKALHGPPAYLRALRRGNVLTA